MSQEKGLENDDFEMPPLTLEALSAWIGKVEDKAWHAQRRALVVDFLPPICC